MYNINYYPNRIQENDRRILTGKVNEVFKIHLNENATTGYAWAVSQMPPNICLLESYYTPDSINPYIVGSSGTRTFLFGGLSEGEGQLVLIHVAVWDLLNPIDTAIFDVRIQPRIE